MNRHNELLQEACEYLQVFVNHAVDVWDDVPTDERREWSFDDARNAQAFIEWCEKQGLVSLKGIDNEV